MAKVMQLLDPTTGLMECKVCRKRILANLQSGYDRKDGKTQYHRGSWQCPNGCKVKKEN